MQLRMQGRNVNQPPPESDQLKSRLRQDYSACATLSLDAPEGVPGDVDVLLVIKPRGLSERAVYALDQYVMRGGRLILLSGSYDPQFGQGGLAVMPIDSGLDEWLKHHGVEIGKTLLLDDRNQPLPIPEVRQTVFGAIQTWSLRPYPYLVEIRDEGLQNHAITAKLDAVGIYWGSPLEVLPDAQKRLKVTPVLSSSSRSWTDADPQKVAQASYTVPLGSKPHLVAVALQGQFDSDWAGKPAPIAPGDSTRRDVPIPRSPETRVVVVGDAELVSDMVAGALGRQAGGLYLQNLGFVQNLVDWMNLDDDLVAIRTRASAARPIHRMSRRAEITLEAANYLVPLLVLAGFGVARYGRRRRVQPLVAARAPRRLRGRPDVDRTQRVLAGVLAAQIVLLVILHNPFVRAHAGSDQKLLPTLASITPEKIEIAAGGRRIAHARAARRRVGARAARRIPGGAGQGREVIQDLEHMTAGRAVASDKRSYAALKVADDQFERRVRLWAKPTGNPAAEIYLGSSPSAGVTHVRVGGSDRVLEASGLSVWDVAADPGSWIDRTLVPFRPEEVVRMSLTNRKSGFTLEKREGTWRVASPSARAPRRWIPSRWWTSSGRWPA